MGDVKRKLQKAFADSPDVTQTEIANVIGVHRSVINRQLRGLQDISVGRIAEIGWCLGYDADFSFIKRKPIEGDNTPPRTSFTSTVSSTQREARVADKILELHQ